MIYEKISYCILFCVESIIAWLYYDYIFLPKKTRQYQLTFFFCSYFFLFFVSFVESTTLNAVSFWIANLLIAFYCYHCDLKSAFLHSAFLCFIMLGAEILVALVIGLFGFDFNAYTYNFQAMLLLMVLSKLLYLALSVIASRVFSPHKYPNIEPQFMILYCCIPTISAVIAIATVYMGMTAGISGIVGLMTTITIISLFIFNLIILFLYNYLQKANEEHFALQLSIQKSEAETTYYQFLQEQLDSQKVLVHDIKNHLNSINDIAENIGATDIENYISSIITSLTPTRAPTLCSDSFLNLLLIRFQNECIHQGITFYCDIREKVSSFMDAPSITALYSNLLSNAIDAAVNSEAKEIELSVTHNDIQSCIVISIINSCDSPPISDGQNSFITKKNKNKLHGIGLKSISRVVKKYDGVSTMYYSSEHRQFHHIIQLPTPPSQNS